MTEKLLENSKISHYRIVSSIGSGGMGDVYLAEDTELERQVALKILPAEVAADEDRVRRFVQEAKAASALNHPNILTVYEIGNYDGSRYISTELIKGKTLRQRLRGEPLTLREILGVALQSAAALNAAHEAGIVHRDIKPENIMLRDDDFVKILDFGLAKLSERQPEISSSEDATRAQVNTRPGMVMGTVAYMSPEQTRGKNIDARSDIWSLGVVIYEMLTGTTPFAGETPNDSVAAILAKDPPPLDGNVPPELQRIIRKSLQKNVDERYQTVKDMLLDVKNLKRELEFSEELERSHMPTSTRSSDVSTGHISENTTPTHPASFSTQNSMPQQRSSAEYLVSEIKSHKRVVGAALVALLFLMVVSGYWLYKYRDSSTGQINSIAVLPFENRSGNADSEYLSDGLAESLIYRLSQLPNLKVSPTSSVFRYKGKEIDPQKVGIELGVSAVMTGRMVQRGDNLTISVELVDVRNNKLLWGEQFERKMSELLATQREIATAITEKLQLKLAGDDATGITKHYTENNEAYQAYLKGRYYWKKRGGKNINTGIGYFQEAIKTDPNFALAWSGLADSYVILPEYTATSVSEALPKAKQAAQKASELDPELAEAHASLGYIDYVYEWNFSAADTEFRRSIELNPNYTTARQWYAEMLIMCGRYDEAVVQAQKAVELEPLSALQKFIYGVVLYGGRRYDDAAKQLDAALELDPDFARLNYFKAQNAIEIGDYNGALKACDKAIAGDEEVYKYCPAFVYAKKGDKNRAYQIISGAPSGGAAGDATRSIVYSILGDNDKAFELLEKLYDERSVFAVYIQAFPGYDNLRSDPRYKDLVKKVGLSEKN